MSYDGKWGSILETAVGEVRCGDGDGGRDSEGHKQGTRGEGREAGYGKGSW